MKLPNNLFTASVCALMLSVAPGGLLLYPSSAEANSLTREGGFRAMPTRAPSGARSRDIDRRPSTPSARPSRPQITPSRPAPRPVMQPSQRPSTRPVMQPSQRPSTRPVPGQIQRPVQRPTPARPDRPYNRPTPVSPNRPGLRPPVRPYPPNVRPPLHSRPPGWRPPHWRPPLWRPPSWRPPYYRPPYSRPPHWHWGSYYWNPRWQWYFTAVVGAATLVFVDKPPADEKCVEIEADGETAYVCDGVLYRATYYNDELVYEIVSEPGEVIDGADKW
jgi:hypothetical protein